MAGFLGRLRVRLVGGGRAARYFLYAAGEVVLIVLGILLAFQVDAWREKTGNAARELDVLRQIRADLERDTAEYNGFVETRINVTVPYLTAIYEKDWAGVPLDSLQLIGTTYFAFLPFNSAYQGLKSSGSLSTISDDELRAEITSYYEREHLHLTDWSTWHKNFVTNTLEPYMFNELVMNPQELVADLDHLKAKLSERRLNSLIATQIGSLTRLNVEIQAAKDRAVGIIRRIETVTGGTD